MLLLFLPLVAVIVLYLRIDKDYFSGIPECKGNLKRFEGYVICTYINGSDTSKWAAYQLTGKEAMGILPVEKKKNIIQLAPTQDFKWSRQSIANTYQIQNAIIMQPDLYSKIWQPLEVIINRWAVKHHRLYIVSGVSVSAGKTLYYKAVLDYKDPDIKAIGFLFLADENYNDPTDCVVSVQALEKVIGYNLFPKLPKLIAEKIESTADYKVW